MTLSAAAEIISLLQSIETARDDAKLNGNYKSAIKSYEQGLLHLGELISTSRDDRYYDRLTDLRPKLQAELEILYDLTEALNSLKASTAPEPQKSNNDEYIRDPDVWDAPAPMSRGGGRPDNRALYVPERRQPSQPAPTNKNQNNQNDLPAWARGRDDNDRPRTNAAPAPQQKPSDYANIRDARLNSRSPAPMDDPASRIEKIRKDRDSVGMSNVNPCSAAVNASNQRDQRDPAPGPLVRRKTPTPTPAPAPSSSRRSNSGAPAKPAVPPRPGAKTTPEEVNPLSEYENQIMTEMLDKSPDIRWDDIAGLSYAKQTLQEAVILPNLRPDLFVGLRRPPKGVLLFGPPGTGKTLLAKAVATESGFVFFSITSSSVMSKYLGEGEKLMRALFSVARKEQPSVIFFDEIDAMMSARKENEHEASRRMKTEFMTQVDGATTSAEDRILIMAATNIPWELDEAVLRRLVKRIYVPLPDEEARAGLIKHLMRKQGSGGGGIVEDEEKLNAVVQMTGGYSGSDLSAVCHEAAMGPIRELGPAALLSVKAEDVRALEEKDFAYAVQSIRPSVSPDSLLHYSQWAEQFGVTR